MKIKAGGNDVKRKPSKCISPPDFAVSVPKQCFFSRKHNFNVFVEKMELSPALKMELLC